MTVQSETGVENRANEEAPEGAYVPWIVNLSGEGELSGEGQAQSSEASVRAMFRALADRDTLLLHAHGGLNPERRGLELARSLGAEIVLKRPSVVPIFLVWETGFWEIFGPALRELLQHNRLGVKLLAWVFRTVSTELVPGVPGPGVPRRVTEGERREEEEIAASLLHGLEADTELADALQAVVSRRGLESVETEVVGLDPDFLAEVTAPFEADHDGLESRPLSRMIGFARVVARVALAVARRKAAPLSWNGGREVVVEEVLRVLGGGALGQALWRRIQLQASTAYLPGRGGTLLMDELAAWLGASPTRRLHLVGQSAGAFHVGAWLRELAARRPGDTRLVDQVVLWAPACDHRFFLENIESLIDRVGRLRMFVLHEAVEDADPMVPGLYESSLLCLVSGLLEAQPGWPILGMARFLDRAEGEVAERVRAVMGSRCVRTPTAPDAPPGERSGARQHGAFSGDSLTRGSLVVGV